MDLSGLLPLFEDMAAYRSLRERLGQEKGTLRLLVLAAARAPLLAALWRDLRRPTVVLVDSLEAARRLHEDLSCWCGSAEVGLFPAWETLPFERILPDAGIVRQRLRLLSQWQQPGSVALVVTSMRAAATKTLAPQKLGRATQRLAPGDQVTRERLLRGWVAMGYEAAPTVELPGQFSRRGGILDIFPPTSDLPARIELWGDHIESLRLFDPTTQRSLRLVDAVTVVPAKEMVADPDRALPPLDLSSCTPQERERLEQELALLREGQLCAGADFYAPLLASASMLDHLPPQSLVILVEPQNLRQALADHEAQAGELRRSLEERGELPRGYPSPYVSWQELQGQLSKNRCLALEGWEAGEELDLLRVGAFVPPEVYAGRLRNLTEAIGRLQRHGERVILVSHQAPRLAELLAEEGGEALVAETIAAPPPPGSVVVIPGGLAEGWRLLGRGPGYPTTLLTDAEIFGFRKQRRLVKERVVAPERLLAEFSPGDYVVHVDHGIARFRGLVLMSIEGAQREYLLLEYAAGDKLYVPTDQVARISRYVGFREGPPALSRLGTQEWHRTKERVRHAVGDLARELLSLYAARQVLLGLAFSPDTPWQQELEASFPYVETPDQLLVLREVKADMEQPKPMDRLICGDVGYGKTEVALRAAFKAVMDGRQVALLVPTTVLAQQHALTFAERLGAFPAHLEMLSRFRTAREQEEVLQGLREGAVDIVIGTHRLLQKDVAFKNLGLVIIDEEQRFGVAHKERLKQMRREVDVLTLSATPIPRTLHMSLVGVRDLSTMATPPEARQPIKTFVGEEADPLMREAVLRELDRGGQVFFVHNRVQSIAGVAQRLQELLPEAKIVVGHGQMPEEDLERVMLDFAQGRSDVLVCTTIIESGLDMPNVNTIIVRDAHKMGLAQLYQLRGRVGRGANRAYAYLLYPKGRRLSEAAQQRLRTIFEATELGAGFRIALKDLEIRGAGNLLGPEQSGHIGAVGFALYCRLLGEAVAQHKASRGQEAPPQKEPTPPRAPIIDLPLSAYLPPSYVEDLSMRLELYQRLAACWTPEAVEEMTQELRDRFGEPPPPTQGLMTVLRLRALALRAGVTALQRENHHVVIRMRDGIRFDRAALERAFPQGLRMGTTQLRMEIAPPSPRAGRRPWPETLERVLETLALAEVPRGTATPPLAPAHAHNRRRR